MTENLACTELIFLYAIFSSPNQSPSEGNQNRIITRTVFFMHSIFDDLEKTSNVKPMFRINWCALVVWWWLLFKQAHKTVLCHCWAPWSEGRVRRDPGTRPVPNFFSSTRPVPTRKLKMTGYRVIKFHFESNETQPRMKRTANKVKDPINPSTGNHFLSFIEESEQEQMQ